jgi:hypothetical protein
MYAILRILNDARLGQMPSIKHVIIIISLLFSSSISLNAAVLFKGCNYINAFNDCVLNGNVAEIYIFDEIDDETLKRISHFNNLLFSDLPFPIVNVNTVGGSIDAGMKIGRILRQRKATVQSGDYFGQSSVPACSSSCVKIAAGATTRNLLRIGLHQSIFYAYQEDGSVIKKPLTPEQTKAEDDYYTEMGILREVRDIELNTAFNEMHEIIYKTQLPLTEQKLHQLGFLMREPAIGQLALYNLESNEPPADERKLKAAFEETNDSFFAFKLGQRYLFGLFGAPINIPVAKEWLHTAADANNADSLYLLGYIVEHVEKPVDIHLAKKYYRKSAALGNKHSNKVLRLFKK